LGTDDWRFCLSPRRQIGRKDTRSHKNVGAQRLSECGSNKRKGRGGEQKRVKVVGKRKGTTSPGRGEKLGFCSSAGKNMEHEERLQSHGRTECDKKGKPDQQLQTGKNGKDIGRREI